MAISNSTKDTITSWYKNYLGRDADEGGLNYYAGMLDSGLGADYLENDIKNSAEAKTRAATPGTGLVGSVISGATTPASTTSGSAATASVISGNTGAAATPASTYVSPMDAMTAYEKANAQLQIEDPGAFSGGREKALEDAQWANMNEQQRSDFKINQGQPGEQYINSGGSWIPNPDYDPNFETRYNGSKQLADKYVAGQKYNLDGTPKGSAAAAGNKGPGTGLVGSALSPAPAGTKSMGAGGSGSGANIGGLVNSGGSTGETFLDLSKLKTRVIDPTTETVQGQVNSITAKDGVLMQAARERSRRESNARGLVNSTMAETAGEEAVINTAMPIATADAAAYRGAGDYNTQLINQGTMFNAETANKFGSQRLGIAADKDLQANSLRSAFDIAQLQADTSRYGTDSSAATSRYTADKSAATNKYSTDVGANTAKYQTDQNNATRLTEANIQVGFQKYKADMDVAAAAANANTGNAAKLQQQLASDKATLIRGIIGSTEMSPDRKAALLEQLGEGTAAKNGQPGTGLAGAVYILSDIGSDLVYNPGAERAAADNTP